MLWLLFVIFSQPPGEMNCIRGKLADYGVDHLVLSPEGVLLVPSPGTESPYPRPPESLKHGPDNCDSDVSGARNYFAGFVK